MCVLFSFDYISYISEEYKENVYAWAHNMLKYLRWQYTLLYGVEMTIYMQQPRNFIDWIYAMDTLCFCRLSAGLSSHS